ncbi:hypothetical protein RB653_002166 [Dictyostelium firmibasis]|uniref:Alpha-1,3-glucosyltransferase n=1 Tax=Dictyostelium firmibasis TaxID=79012 RepID=A0AAN7TWQ7_9MYCE
MIKKNNTIITPKDDNCFFKEIKDILKFSRNWNLIILVSTIKLLLIPSYFSTDFEVHRNWLAITSSLPISKWYFENTSEWTLDYPPLFGWFEYCLSKVANYFDSGMLIINNLNYKTTSTILFQRFSVIFSDFLFILSTLLLSNYIYNVMIKKNQNNNNNNNSLPWYHDKSFIISSIVILNPGLLMVDHIHFQYNGFLKGILILSIYFLIRGNILIGSILFSVLLNFKHIYMYMAPAFFVYLLKYYCLKSKSNDNITKVNGSGKQQQQQEQEFSILGVKIFNLVKLGFSVLSIFLLSLGPFFYMGQIQQLISRLFPFGRGLSHAYWAPNFWSIYNFLDRVLLFNGLYKKIPFFKDFIIPDQITGNLTSGLVGSETQSHIILPKITPPITLLITILFLVPSIYSILKSKSWKHFILGICQSSFTFFMFGWHVHEKAIIMITIPMGFLCLVNNKFSKLYFLLSTIGHYSLFPLLFQVEEIPTRILILVTYTLLVYLSYISSSSNNNNNNNNNSNNKNNNNNNNYNNNIKNNNSNNNNCSFSLKLYWFEKIYLFGIILLEIFNVFIHPIFLGQVERFSFISLMLTSVYTSIGIIYCYLFTFKLIFKNEF